MDRETKALQFEIKGVKEDGTFEGLASTYGEPPDSYGDIIEKGAFAKTIEEHGGEVVVLWQHDTAEPVGMGRLEDTAEGLVIKGKLETEIPTAQKAYIALKAKLVKGLSIGFRVIRKKSEKGIRYLKEIKLYEVSLVTFPANDRATVTGVKSALSDALEDRKAANRVWGTWSAFDSVVYQVMFDHESTVTDKIKSIGDIIDEFKTEFLMALPDYLKRIRVNSDDPGKSLSEEDAEAIRSEIKSLQALLKPAAGTSKEAAGTDDSDAADTKSPAPEDAFHPEQLAGFRDSIKADLNSLNQ